jgi:hypothetical protein
MIESQQASTKVGLSDNVDALKSIYLFSLDFHEYPWLPSMDGTAFDLK